MDLLFSVISIQMKQKTGQPITIVMSRFNSYYIVQCIQQPQLWLQAHKSLHKSRMKHCKNIAGDPASCIIPYIIYSGIKIDLTAVTISYLFRPATQITKICVTFCLAPIYFLRILSLMVKFVSLSTINSLDYVQ